MEIKGLQGVGGREGYKTESGMKPEREPESERGVGGWGVRNRWADGGGDGWMGELGCWELLSKVGLH